MTWVSKYLTNRSKQAIFLPTDDENFRADEMTTYGVFRGGGLGCIYRDMSLNSFWRRYDGKVIPPPWFTVLIT